MLEIQVAKSSSIGPHWHDVVIHQSQFTVLNAGKPVRVTSEKGAGHEHVIDVIKDRATGDYYIKRCSGMSDVDPICWDKHPKILKVKLQQ